MTDQELVFAIDRIKVERDRRFARLEAQAQQIQQDTEDKIDQLLRDQERRRCTACNGQGKVGKLDAGYMKRFGLREWNGCEACGGNGNDIPGRGFTS